MRIRRLLSLALAAGALTGCQMQGSHGADQRGSAPHDESAVPEGAIPAAADTRPGVAAERVGQPTQVDSAVAVQPGAPQQKPVITPLPPADTTPR